MWNKVQREERGGAFPSIPPLVVRRQDSPLLRDQPLLWVARSMISPPLLLPEQESPCFQTRFPSHSKAVVMEEVHEVDEVAAALVLACGAEGAAEMDPP